MRQKASGGFDKQPPAPYLRLCAARLARQASGPTSRKAAHIRAAALGRVAAEG